MNKTALKNFLEETAPYKDPKTDKDLRVDQFANFRIKFHKVYDADFTESNYNSYLVRLLFGGDIHRYIKSINDVELNIKGSDLTLPGSSYMMHRLLPMNSSNFITMNWLNTKTPFIETVFVPWMQDNTINNRFPILKADIQIQFPKFNMSNTLSYWYYGARPSEVSLHKMTNEPITEFYRKVNFDFDYFYVEFNSTPINEITQQEIDDMEKSVISDYTIDSLARIDEVPPETVELTGNQEWAYNEALRLNNNRA